MALPSSFLSPESLHPTPTVSLETCISLRQRQEWHSQLGSHPPSHLPLQGTLSDSDLHPLPQDPQLRELVPPLPQGDPQQDLIGLETQAKPVKE